MPDCKPCPKCRNPVDLYGRCWPCRDWVCACGRMTGSCLISQCWACQCERERAEREKAKQPAPEQEWLPW